ncbi:MULTISPECIES: hypothetical protein [unclassified Bradyrhizobium]|uniref:hypothetical protein n=1 Tax=unclassified Bradyrhizobium TaxID=2631580 RepID=UPI001CD664FD|nr:MULTISPECIES: hypothetical protein [unclassified Bradyrhizobium]MCA1384207.1 hypothetical protein [Bradyrhizobium sp. BRP05]MCA1420949.1 hypothetical protein [Bradyrhizobium sp. BRP23]MCA1430851.1 hypothetical protein [Bradyrhizobium sp. NBAIM16]MCA1479875.1 hypothetical protein [Bradyrhizobium sp. NBAIM08]MCA1506062.1 hypothetical protein [Bradyrhizobium sp. NBAIM02]
MKGIGRADSSQGEAAGADSAGELSRSSLEPGLFPGERGQSFDAVLERMRSGPQDRTAASDMAAPTRNEIKAAKRNLDSLLEKFEACRRAATQRCNLEKAQELIDRVVEAGSAVLEHYANLPANLARRILPDDQARRLRDDTLDAGNQCNKAATHIIYQLENRREQAAALLDHVKDTAPPEQLSRVVAGVANQYAACMEWWGKKALRFERMQSVCAATAHLPSSTPEMRKAEEAELRLNTGWALTTKCMYLQSRIALAQLLIESQASTLAPEARAALMDESGRVRLLGTFVGDVFPAFVSTGDAVRGGAVLDAEHRAVLEGVMERLSEFASQLRGMLAPLREAGTQADLPLQLLGEIVDGAWVTANDVMRLLALQPKTEVTIEPPAWAALPENTALVGEGTPVRRKGKARRGAAAGEGSSTASPPAAQLARPDVTTAPTGKVIVLSDLGTKKLATPEEAAASSSATDHLQMWQAPPSRKALPGLLERLDELLQFDLRAQQSAVSQARQMKPEDAEHVLNRVIKRLQTQSSEIEACVVALEEPRRRGMLTAAQVPEVHEKIVRLQRMGSEVQGQAKSLSARKAAITSDCMKSYAFPSQKYLAQLRAAGELASVDPPRALKGEPGTLFEIKLQPMALSNGGTPRPMWVHIHTKRPVHAWQLATLGDREFAASHVKSDEQRGYNQHWQNARAAEGHENVVVHRGKLTPAFCRSLLSTAAGQPWQPLPDPEHASAQMARLGI